MATIEPGLSLFAFVALFVLITAAVTSLDPHAVWERAEECR
jgi:uncharacterized paraquat-inducible protein A